MKLWEVTNGYMGNGYVHVLTIANTESDAIEFARPVFKEQINTAIQASDKFYTELKAIELGEAKIGWTSEVRE